MSFKYDLTANQQTPTSDSKVVLCKSFKIDIANGSGFTSGQTYDLGWLPKDAQIILSSYGIATAVSGGTVSAATLAVTCGGDAFISGINVFTTSGSVSFSAGYSTSLSTPETSDQKLVYTPTLTGAGATAGVIYINIFYVI